jgi:hypothetical protein
MLFIHGVPVIAVRDGREMSKWRAVLSQKSEDDPVKSPVAPGNTILPVVNPVCSVPAIHKSLIRRADKPMF